MIKKDNELRGTVSCKIALYREFFKCGIKTWDQVVKALEKSGHGKIADNVKMKLLEVYNEVMYQYILASCFLTQYNYFTH